LFLVIVYMYPFVELGNLDFKMTWWDVGLSSMAGVTMW